MISIKSQKINSENCLTKTQDNAKKKFEVYCLTSVRCMLIKTFKREEKHVNDRPNLEDVKVAKFLAE